MDALRQSSAFIKHIATHSENLVTFYHQLATIGVIDLWRWTPALGDRPGAKNRLVCVTLAPVVVLHLPPSEALVQHVHTREEVEPARNYLPLLCGTHGTGFRSPALTPA